VKREWVAAPGDLTTLVAWLAGNGPGDRAGESYIAMHGRLSSYFARKGCRAPEELADETLSRVVRRLHEEEAEIDVPPAQYCYIVARFVFLEHLRSPDHHAVALVRDVPERPHAPDGEAEERLLTCLDDCLGQLDPDDRALILEYYSGAQPDRIIIRRKLAARLGLSANAMGIRACRLRERLRTCVSRCESGS
jgi:DNA-directed RNA polymerase specialized sigma24 family protein